VKPRTIYTLGTSTRSIDDLLEIITEYGIRAVADVRRFPSSTRYPHFGRQNLETVMKERGLAYYWLGDLLGGYRKGGYTAYQQERSYLRGLEELESIAKKMRTALMCAERFPWKCHRLQIAGSLLERGWDVVHIIDKDRTWQPGRH